MHHTGTGDSCVVGVPEGGTVARLKADALNEMFPGSTNADREAACVAAHIEGCEEELDDARRVADTGLKNQGVLKLVPRWPNVKAPVVYSTTHGEEIYSITLSRCGKLCSVGSSKGHITVFDTVTAGVVADFQRSTDMIHCTAFSVCGMWLATCSRDGTICVWLTSTWEQVCILHNNDDVWRAAWTHCGRLVFRRLHRQPSCVGLEGHTERHSAGGSQQGCSQHCCVGHEDLQRVR